MCLLVAALPAFAGGDERTDLLRERDRLIRENAMLEARLSLSKEPNVYLVADLSRKQIQLQLQGVDLTSFPVEEVRLNRHAERVLSGEERGALLQTPFVLQEDRWFEESKTLALKDSTAIRSKADTTGALMQAIRTSPVTAMLSYDRRLTLVLQGEPELTGWQKLRRKASDWLESWSTGTLQGILRRQSSDEVMVTLRMAPAEVRSLAPTLAEGTKLIVVL